MAVFGAGCFWGVEAAFRQVPGVVSTVVGYAGGHTANPTYRDVCRHDTGHAEVVQVTFDPFRVTYPELLDVFWSIHDPTDPTGPDDASGGQYRSLILFHDEDQRSAAEAARVELDRSGGFDAPVATEIGPESTFDRAEDHHQQFVERGGLFGSTPAGPSCDHLPSR